jgi:hypothetical protein
MSKKEAKNCFLFLFSNMQKKNGTTYTLKKGKK